MTLDQEALYEMLFASATEGIVISSESGRIEGANQRAADMFGYTLEELKQRNVDDLLPKHLASKHKEHRAGYTSAPRKRSMGLGYDLIGVRKDGSSFPLEISLNHYRIDGSLKVMALIMDVTVRKEQEAQIKMLNKTLERRVEKRTKELQESQLLYSTIARNFPNGTINVFDRDFNYVFVEGEELFRYGITSTMLMGKNYITRLPVEVRETMRERLSLVLEGQNQSFEIIQANQHYLINAVGLSFTEENIDRILLVEQNITAQKKAEEHVKDALKKEQHLNELKSRFVSLASHEFRTPLSTVLSSLSLIEKYDKAGIQEKKGKHYKRIRSSVRHLTNILNDFLSLEKVEAGKVNVNPSTFSLRQTVQDWIEQHQEIAKPGQQLVLHYEGDEDAHTDLHMLHIILSNLLSNAIKYSDENKQIDIRVLSKDDDIRIEVEDHGIGIPIDDQANMFERFFRANNATNIEGTGLGLNIVKRYLQMLGGSITFESQPDQGTIFKIHIPQKD